MDKSASYIHTLLSYFNISFTPESAKGFPQSPPQQNPQHGRQVGTVVHSEALVLADQLAGNIFVIPDLNKVFAHWPCRLHPEIARLRSLVDSLLERIITDHRKLSALRKADFGLLMA